MESKVYDVVIIGSGLGGLECGAILSKEGYNVCVLEQHQIFGGCLQSFNRNGRVIDTGIHYIGSMGEGQIMRNYLKYFGIFNNLNIKRLDDDFDIFSFGDSSFSYKQGLENFKASLIDKFIDQADGIREYCRKIKEVGSTISVEVHKSGKLTRGSIENLSISVNEFINSCVCNEELRSILGANNMLYGGGKYTADLYHHAMISYSNIEGPYRVIGGTQQIADLLIKQIISNGGVVINNSKVTSINVADSGAYVESINVAGTYRVFAKSFISNLHPATTYNMLTKSPLIKKAYKSRLNLLPNSIGFFSLYLLIKPGKFKYINSNHYLNRDYNVWAAPLSTSCLEINTAFLSMQPDMQNSNYTSVVSIMVPIDYTLFTKWEHTDIKSRDSEYRELKRSITNKIIEFVSTFYPTLNESIERVYSASPLTYSYYTGTPHGSAYGYLKSYKSALVSLFSTKTKLNNLYLTGQNINVHGALGVTVTAASTCANFLGEEYLAKRIGAM